MGLKLESWVEEKFDGHLDHAGKPYYGHCEFVADFARQYAEALGLSAHDVEVVYQSGLCHDLLEDTGTDVAELLAMTSREVVEIVSVLTHSPDVPYEVYFEQVKTNRLATVVKLADTAHNAMLTRFDREDRSQVVREDCQRYTNRFLDMQKTILSWQ